MLSLICPVCGLEIPPHTKIVFVKLREDGSPILFELGVACDHVPVPDGAIPFGSLGCAKDVSKSFRSAAKLFVIKETSCR
jgi:hypothetical protein